MGCNRGLASVAHVVIALGLFDPKQDIFGRDGLRALDLQPVELTYTCRNTEAIARFAHAFVGSEPRLLPGTPPGCQVETITCKSVEEMREGLRKAIHRLAGAAQLAPERIVVLSPRSQSEPVCLQDIRELPSD